MVLHHVLEAFRRRQIELYAACVMPDHLHLLCEPQPKLRDADGKPISWSLGEIMSGIKSVSAHRINKALGQKGIVWEKEYFDTMVRGDDDLEGRFWYIVKNPIEAGLVKEGGGYEWLWTRDELGRVGIEGGRQEQGFSPEQSARARTAAREGACAPMK